MEREKNVLEDLDRRLTAAENRCVALEERAKLAEEKVNELQNTKTDEKPAASETNSQKVIDKLRYQILHLKRALKEKDNKQSGKE